VGRAVLDRRTIHVPDLQAEGDAYPESAVLRLPDMVPRATAGGIVPIWEPKQTPTPRRRCEVAIPFWAADP
jgi:hypothetical protein